MSYTSPNWSTSALITIDTQNDAVLPNAPLEVQGTYDIVPNMSRLLEAYRNRGLPIIHVVRFYRTDGSNVDLCRREMVEKGAAVWAPNTEGAELVEGIRPPGYLSLDSERLMSGEFQSIGNQEWVMYKSRWGAFYRTNLESFLHELGVDTLVFTGCNFPNCPRTSMYEASERDFRVAMVSDSMSQVYERGNEEMKRIGVHVCSMSEVLEAVGRVPSI